MKNQICTILGGGGFIGRYLVRNLTKKNYRCIISTRKAFQKGYLKTQAPPGAVELVDWNPSNFSELKEAEIIRERLELLAQLDEYVGNYYSKEWVQKNILRQSDEDIDMMAKQIDTERAAGKIPDEDDLEI